MILDWFCRAAFFIGRMASGKWKTKYAADSEGKTEI